MNGRAWLFLILSCLSTPLWAGEIIRHNLTREDLNLIHPLGVSGCGPALNDTTLECVITSLGSHARTLLITPGTWTIANNRTVPANVRLLFAKGAMVSVNNGVTLTLNQEPTCEPRQQCFTGAGAVVLANTPTVHVGWFGALCDGSTNDTAALSAAVNAAVADTIVQIPEGTCLTSGLTMATRSITLRGHGWQPTGAFAATTLGSGLKAVGSQAYVLRVINQYNRIEDLRFDGNFLTTTAVVFFEMSGSGPHNTVMERVLIERTLPNTLGSGQAALLQLGGDTNSQVDFLSLRNSTLIQDSSGGVTKAAYGILVKNTNTFQSWGDAIYVSGTIACVEFRAASMSFRGLQCEHSSFGVQINLNSQPFVIQDYYQETSNQAWLRMLNPTNENSNAITFINPQINGSNNTATWYPIQPLILISGNFRLSSFLVEDPGGGAGNQCVTSVHSTFSQDGAGFSGDLLARVNEHDTRATTSGGTVTAYQTVIRCGTIAFQPATQVDMTALRIGGVSGTTMSAVRKWSFAATNAGEVTAGACLDTSTLTATGLPATAALYGESIGAAIPAGWTLQAYVSGTSNVRFRWCNFTGVNADPDGAGTTYTVYSVAP